MEIPNHNRILLDLWKKNLNDEEALAYAALGITLDGRKFSVHVMPGISKDHLAKVFRDAADSLDRGKLVILGS